MPFGPAWWRRKGRIRLALRRATCASKSRRKRRWVASVNPRISLVSRSSSPLLTQPGLRAKHSSSRGACVSNKKQRKETSMAGIADSTAKTIVLVHGGFVDGSGWEDVYKILTKDGYRVAIVQNRTLSLADDVPATKRVIHAQTAPVLLVANSYAAARIPERGPDPRAAGVVFAVEVCRSDSGWKRWESRDLWVAARCGGGAHRKSHQRNEGGSALSVASVVM